MTLTKPESRFLMTTTSLFILGSQTTLAGTMGNIESTAPPYIKP